MRKKPKKSPLQLLDQEAIENLSKEVLIKMMENPGMTIKDATGISEESLEEVYSLAYTYYTQGKYQESIALFEFLAGTSPTVYKYAFGLGASHHQIQNYEEAAIAFFISLQLDPENPIPAYYVTDCMLKQNLNEEAEELAELTSSICGKRPEYAELKQRCDLIVRSLKGKQ